MARAQNWKIIFSQNMLKFISTQNSEWMVMKKCIFISIRVCSLNRSRDCTAVLRLQILSTNAMVEILEPVCCKKRWKKSQPRNWFLGFKLNLNDEESRSCSFRGNWASFRTFKCPLFSKPVSWLELFLPFLIANRL